MTSAAIRKRYIEFFRQRGHQEIPPAPIVPPEDPTTLFTSSGMQQLVPFLKGRKHPLGSRLVNSQPCFRAEDIDEVGDTRHTTFFEMLGNWSLGDYFKAEQLPWIYEFLTTVVGLTPDRLYVTVFAGDAHIPHDEESVGIWQQLLGTDNPAQPGYQGFDPEVRIYTYGAHQNWWSRSGTPEMMPTGEIGGPDSEVFFDFGARYRLHEESPQKDHPCHLNCNCGRFLEIANSVFIEYEKANDGSFMTLPKRNVDFGAGLERLAAASQDTPDIFTSDAFLPIIQQVAKSTGKQYEGQDKSPMRVIADHLRAATVMLAQGVEPSNKTQGYILRRLLRRAALNLRNLGGAIDSQALSSIAAVVLQQYQGIAVSATMTRERVREILEPEMTKFQRTLERGIKLIDQQEPGTIDARFVFDLYQSHGIPFDISQELLARRGITIEKGAFATQFQRHQKLSRQAAAGLFKGGLADQEESTVKLHTATHLLHRALRAILGDHVRQEGSHITEKRLRFDFSHPQALSERQLRQVEELVNRKIAENLPVHRTIEERQAALRSGALAFFKETYPQKVSVYTIGKDPKRGWFSKELCGGPHVRATGEIGALKIIKQQSLGTGKRRLYAILTNPPRPLLTG